MFIKRIKDIFNLDNPMRRLRYFVTYLIFILIISPIIFVLTPEMIIYNGDETLFTAIINGTFEKTEVLLYILVSGVFCYAVEFFLDAKRLLDIIGNKKTAILISAIIATIGILAEYFIPLYSDNYDLTGLYMIFALGLFAFLCLKKGIQKDEQQTEIETSEPNESAPN